MVFDLIGCDFSSSPSRRKPIMLALGHRQGARVVLAGLERFETLAAFGQWLYAQYREGDGTAYRYSC